MRHRRDHRQLSRTAEHRKALLRNLVTALFQYERITTSVAKAKETRRLAERLITKAKRGDLAARRHVERFVYRETVAKKLFDTIAPWYAERPGGYTRIVRVGKRRVGDASEVALLELVKTAEQKARERRAREEQAAAKAGRKLARRKAEEEPEAEPAVAEEKEKEPAAAAEPKRKAAPARPTEPPKPQPKPDKKSWKRFFIPGRKKGGGE